MASVYSITTVDSSGNTIISTVTVGAGAATSTAPSASPTPTRTPSPVRSSKTKSQTQSTTSNSRRKSLTHSIHSIGSSAHHTSLPEPGTLSAGVKAGIGIGAAVGALLILAVLLLALKRKNKTQKAPGEEIINEKIGTTSRWNSKKGHFLPTWKSELAAESHVVELDASSEIARAELDTVRSPVQVGDESDVLPAELYGTGRPAQLDSTSASLDRRLEMSDSSVGENGTNGQDPGEALDVR